MPREAVWPKREAEIYNAGYSPAIKVAAGDNLLFASGTVGSRADGTPEPDMTKQYELAFDNLNDILTSGGSSFDEIIELTVFHTNIREGDNEKKFFELLKQYFPEKPHPALTVIGSTCLYGFSLELKVVARITK